MLRNFGAPEIIIIAVLVILIFGWKRLPDAARSLGRSARVFKSEVDEMKKEHQAGKTDASSDTVRGDLARERSVDDTVRPDPDGNAVHERTPRTDNQSGTGA
ncbi:Sec-independent protein translocase subunit TatA [Phycicoccus flavus]|uniref:Sec-independent protein translocase subunit TatA n=1 Tax=Phycicoccus flavus TaxID=2502783 RepID=UPI000FEB89E2|nr:Sec-independent protein translocase subunit TatA [Phycicoccus flavus]NHA68352.1 twin-arginine translocase TatA/TatE family subunit [Phycicoccus flavus]